MRAKVGRAPLKIQQQHEHGERVFAAAEANENSVALFYHVEFS